MLVPYTWVPPSLYYFNPSHSRGLEGKQMVVCWYPHAILLWHLSSASEISSFPKVPLMGLIINAKKFLGDCLFYNRDSLGITGQPISSPYGVHSLRRAWTSAKLFERSHPSWALSVCVLGCFRVDPGQHSWLLVHGVLGRRLKSAGVLLIELLSAASYRHNFMMCLHRGLWCPFWVR